MARSRTQQEVLADIVFLAPKFLGLNATCNIVTKENPVVLTFQQIKGQPDSFLEQSSELDPTSSYYIAAQKFNQLGLAATNTDDEGVQHCYICISSSAEKILETLESHAKKNAPKIFAELQTKRVKKQGLTNLNMHQQANNRNASSSSQPPTGTSAPRPNN